jgi:hypothetical protein
VLIALFNFFSKGVFIMNRFIGNTECIINNFRHRCKVYYDIDEEQVTMIEVKEIGRISVPSGIKDEQLMQVAYNHLREIKSLL